MYRVLRGLDYAATAAIDAKLRAAAALPDEDRQAVLAEVRAGGGFLRAEAGDVVADLPAGSIPWLLEQGHIEPARDEAPPIVTSPAPIAPARADTEEPVDHE